LDLGKVAAFMKVEGVKWDIGRLYATIIIEYKYDSELCDY
jgi:hypothetical protein